MVDAIPLTARQTILRLILLTAGTAIWMISVVIFMAPFDIAPAGVSGLAVILNKAINTPIGLVVLIGNIPIQILAYRMLGGWRTVASTVYCVVLFSILTDWATPLLPPQGLSDNVLLNALFGGVIGGVGAGLIYKAGGTAGGTSTLARIFQDRLGLPLSTTYLYVNLIVVAAAGLVFGWEGALYAIVALWVEGVTSDYLLEGPSIIRMALIVTNHPEQVSHAVMDTMHRGVTGWSVTGMYTGQDRTMLLVTVARFQIDLLRQIVAAVDSEAFVIIAQGHVAYGYGFMRPRSALDDAGKTASLKQYVEE
ncbi:MAG: YitT family protein [Anaerolineae bacterium]|nr:YitT family protein [Chloroflexota bacterium]MBP6298597.1 YitT family protein [Anaerolineae bacterium]